MKSQTRNYILFFLTFVLLYGGYIWVRNKWWPPPQRATPEQVAGVKHAAKMLAVAPGAGLANAATLAIAAENDQTKYADLWLALQKAKNEQQAAAKPAAPKPPPQPTKPADLITLGGSDYHIQVTLTNRGAGVRDLILTHFRGVDTNGRPILNPDGSPALQQLIPPSETPSFAIYHYANPDLRDKADQRPLDTLGTRDWQVIEKKTDGDDQRVAFATELPEQGVRLVKTFTLKPKEYHVGLVVRIERLPDSKATTPFRYQLAGGHGLPIEGEWYTSIFRNALFYWVDSAGSGVRVLEDSRSIAHMGGGEKTERNQRRMQYLAVAIQFFTSAIVVDEKQDIIEYGRATVESDDPKHPQLSDITVRAVAEPVSPKPNQPIEHRYLLYHGPVKVGLLGRTTVAGEVAPELIDRYKDTLHLGTLTDYGNYGWWTSAIVFFTNLVHWLIIQLLKIVPNAAICILLVTVIVRLVMLPISRRQAASMARTQEQMAKLQPEIKKIKERFKNDVLEQQRAQSELYRKHGINPLASLGGCLMLFLQMPIFLGLYFAIQESFLFRLESFLWIKNLAAPDMLWNWGDGIKFISEPASQGSFFYLGPYFNLLPILAVALMILQMRWMQPPVADEQMAQQQKMMQFIMMPMFGLMFYKVPAGLCLYFIASTLWGIAERKLIPKKKISESVPAAATLGNNRPGQRAKSKPETPPGKIRAWWEKLLKEASKK